MKTQCIWQWRFIWRLYLIVIWRLMTCISYHNTFNCNLEIMRLVHLNTVSTVCSFVGIYFPTYLLLPKNTAEIKMHQICILSYNRTNITTGFDIILSCIWSILSFKVYIWNLILCHLTCFHSFIAHVKFPIHRICQNQKYWQFSQMTFAEILWLLARSETYFSTE